MPAKFMRAAGAVLAAAVVAAAQGQAQVPDPAALHQNAVEVYVRTGDITRAVEPLQQWKLQDFDGAIDRLIGSKDMARMRATAVFHLEIALALVGLSPGNAKAHIDIGERILDTVRDLHRRGARVDDENVFRATWLAVAGSAFLAVNDPQRGGPYTREAYDLEPKSAHMATVFGIANEVDAGGWNPDDWQTIAQRERNQRERAIRLDRAERAYRDALRLDPDYALASIRLGRVMQLKGKLSEAREPLSRGVAVARGPFEEYLGALFMAALLVDQKDLAGARRSYERALAIAPVSQPATVGLAYVELISGRPDRAQSIISAFAAAKDREPWWAFKDGSLDLPGLAWLRERVHR